MEKILRHFRMAKYDFLFLMFLMGCCAVLLWTGFFLDVCRVRDEIVADSASIELSYLQDELDAFKQLQLERRAALGVEFND
jgi:hypothetical protein